MSIINVGIGFLILIAGRPAYAVFVGGATYLAAAYANERFALTPAGWSPLAVPIIFGALGALSVFVFRRWAARLAGIVAGGYLVYNLPQVFGAQPEWATPIAFAIGGALSFVMLIVLFDGFLIFLSALTAVTLILRDVKFGGLEPAIMFIILLVFSLIAQYLIFEYGKPSPD